MVYKVKGLSMLNLVLRKWTTEIDRPERLDKNYHFMHLFYLFKLLNIETVPNFLVTSFGRNKRASISPFLIDTHIEQADC